MDLQKILETVKSNLKDGVDAERILSDLKSEFELIIQRAIQKPREDRVSSRGFSLSVNFFSTLDYCLGIV